MKLSEQVKLDKYYTNPALCKQCGKVIVPKPYTDLGVMLKGNIATILVI